VISRRIRGGKRKTGSTPNADALREGYSLFERQHERWLTAGASLEELVAPETSAAEAASDVGSSSHPPKGGLIFKDLKRHR